MLRKIQKNYLLTINLIKFNYFNENFLFIYFIQKDIQHLYAFFILF